MEEVNCIYSLSKTLTHYGLFLARFGKQHTFQTFDDKGKDKSLTRQFHGTIEEHFDDLSILNQAGAGIYFTVNQTNLKGRTTEHIKSVRAVFIDLDGAPLPNKFELRQHIILCTSPNKYHCYWITHNLPLNKFRDYQEALSIKFNSDPCVKDLPRIMRVAGFYHQKKKPYPVKILKMHDELSYDYKDIWEALRLKSPEKRVYQQSSGVASDYLGNPLRGSTKGRRHHDMVRMLMAIIHRGMDFEYAKKEAILFANNCNPPLEQQEVLRQLDDIWKRYAVHT